MGMFDELLVKCPNCNKEVSFQSKAGECIMHTYHIDDVPDGIAIDLDGEYMICSNCGNYVSISTQAMISIMVS